jgi:hypothetical protein
MTIEPSDNDKVLQNNIAVPNIEDLSIQDSDIEDV